MCCLLLLSFRVTSARSLEFRACPPALTRGRPEEEFHERVRATFERTAFLSLRLCERCARGLLCFFLFLFLLLSSSSSFSALPPLPPPSRTPLYFVSFSVSHSRPEQRSPVHVCARACVARIISRDLYARTLLILTSGQVFLLGARAARHGSNLYANARLI